MITRRLPPPSVPANLPYGTDRGGIFDAPWESAQYIGPGYAPLPFDASTPRPIPPSTEGHAMQFTSAMPTPMAGYVQMVDPRPLPVKQYNPRNYPHTGGIFAGMGAIEALPTARPEWTRWQVTRRAQARRAMFGMGGCGCPVL